MSKEEILNRIRQVKGDNASLPEIPDFEWERETLQSFIESLKNNHVEVAEVGSEKELVAHVQSLLTAKSISLCEDIYSSERKIAEVEQLSELQDVDVCLVRGELGVAENAAIWVPEENAGQRVLPFITEHLAVILSRKNIVGNMHEAYKKVKVTKGFGVFIAGPSKTADIEQSLVIGAHGPKRMTVFIMK